MDRNTVTGFALLALLLIGYIGWNNYSKSQYNKSLQHIQDSIARTQPARPDSTKKITHAAPTDNPYAGLTDSAQALLPAALRGTGSLVTLENKNLKLTFNTKGGHPVAARLKDFKTYEGQPLDMFNGSANKLTFKLPGGFVSGGSSAPVSTEDLIFTPSNPAPNVLQLTADVGQGRTIVYQYTLPAEGYMMDLQVTATGLGSTTLPMTWQTLALNTERDASIERMNSQVYYNYTNGDHDYYTIKEGNEQKDLSKNAMHWVGLRQHYFASALVRDAGGFTGARVESSVTLPDSNISSSATLVANLPLDGAGTAKMRWFIGPNDYKLLKSYKIGLDEMVPLGFGVFFFVKYVNKWLIIPVFEFLHHNMGIMNMGVVIMLLTIFIRLLLSFFTYKSYLSAAKMRVLKPELDELRAKYGKDQQAMGVEQMKLYRQAGVNPLGGCLPTLFQIPILFAMYYFFPTSIDLRQKSFLWAHDLSTYDSIASIPNIPFYGDHISLFTLLMTVSSLFLALYNRNMTAGQEMNNPMLKWMPYIFPILLLGVFNKMAAALTFYYFFSNLISIVQQFVIQKFVINEKKIHAQIQANKNKPATQSKWAARMEEMQKLQAERMAQRKK